MPGIICDRSGLGKLWVIGRDYDRDPTQPTETKQAINPGALVDALMATGLSGEDALAFAGGMPVSFLNEFMVARNDRMAAETGTKPRHTKKQKEELIQALQKMKAAQNGGNDQIRDLD
jgi:hypothetical protein